MVITVNTLTDLVNFVERSSDTVVQIDNGATGIFSRFDAAHTNLSTVAGHAPDGTFTGTRMTRVREIEQLIKHNEMLESQVNLFKTGGADYFTKNLEKNKGTLQRHFDKMVRDSDYVLTQIAKAEEHIGKDISAVQKQLTRAFDTSFRTLSTELRAAQAPGYAGSRTVADIQADLTALQTRMESATDALIAHQEFRIEPLESMRTDLQFVIKGMEKSTGLSAESVRAGSAVTKAAETGAKGAETTAKGAGGIAERFAMMGTGSKVALGAVAAVTAAWALGLFSKREQRTV